MNALVIAVAKLNVYCTFCMYVCICITRLNVCLPCEVGPVTPILHVGKLRFAVPLLSRSVVSLSSTPWTVTCQAPQSMRFLRQENWSRLPFLSPGDLPDSGNKPRSPAWQVDSLPSEPPRNPNQLNFNKN